MWIKRVKSTLACIHLYTAVWNYQKSNEIVRKFLYTFIQDLSVPTYYTVEPRYNEVLGTMKITLLYQVSHYIRVKTTKKYIKSWDQQNYLVIRGFCYIRPHYNEVPLYMYTPYK